MNNYYYSFYIYCC